MEEEQEVGKQSLMGLTQNILDLLPTLPNGEADLNQLTTSLNTTRRRVYDVINVLQGLNLIEKIGKSRIKLCKKKSKVKINENEKLLQKEEELRIASATLDVYLENMLNSPLFDSYAWVNDQDILPLKETPDAKIFALKGPKSLSISIEPNDNSSYQMSCHADDAPISWISVGRSRKM